jgi:hypothetical protein
MKVVIYERPDTDAIQERTRAYYADSKNLVFKECPTCAAKPGSPTLCESCYHNRYVIRMLRERAKLEGSR